MQGKRIVLINDQPGYGKVALSAMPPILARMGYELMLLPTAIISNTLDYGRFAVRDMTDYMRECVKVWKELKLNYEAACTGYIVSEAQAEFLREYLSDQKKTHGIRVYVDPIMGDWGRLYNSVTEKNVESMRRLCAIADVICPNMTEAQYLAGRFQGREDLTQEEMDEIIEALRQMGASNVVITSACIDGVHQVYGWEGESFSVPYKHFPVNYPGTGDLFAALLVGRNMDGWRLKEAASYAASMIRTFMTEDLRVHSGYKGIPSEWYLERLGAEYGVHDPADTAADAHDEDRAQLEFPQGGQG